MPDAMGIANQLIAEGDGDLSVMGEFADVQYKVRFPALPDHRPPSDGPCAGRYAATNQSCCASVLPTSSTVSRRFLLLPHRRSTISRTAWPPVRPAWKRLRLPGRDCPPLLRPCWSVILCHFNEQGSDAHATRAGGCRSEAAERGDGGCSGDGCSCDSYDTETACARDDTETGRGFGDGGNTQAWGVGQGRAASCCDQGGVMVRRGLRP